MEEINLYHLLRYYASSWRAIIAATFVGLLVALIYSAAIQTPMYRSDATLVMTVSSGNPNRDSVQINNFIELATSRRVLEAAIERSSVDYSYEQTERSITATSEKDTQIITLSATTPVADTSKQLLDATIESFQNEVSELYTSEQLQVVDTASSPDDPVNVNIPVETALGGAVGLLVAVVILFFVYDYRMSKTSSMLAAEQPRRSTRQTSHLSATHVEQPQQTALGSTAGTAMSGSSADTTEDDEMLSNSPDTQPLDLPDEPKKDKKQTPPTPIVTTKAKTSYAGARPRPEMSNSYSSGIFSGALSLLTGKGTHERTVDYSRRPEPKGVDLPLPPSDLTPPTPNMTSTSSRLYYEDHDLSSTDTAKQKEASTYGKDDYPEKTV
ncbi:hypothetical protein CR983_00105 [Candidatus Saccharibacteria bacterium]|nr:MAG: hypothetical protein CR983_00105 [Candidatus Saccharibacteria bacterium]